MPNQPVNKPNEIKQEAVSDQSPNQQEQYDDARVRANNPDNREANRRANDESNRAHFDPSDLANPQALPTNRDPNSPEMQSLQATVDAQRKLHGEKESRNKNDTVVRLHWRTTGGSDTYHDRSNVRFENGFVVMQTEEGKTIAYPSDQVTAVEFGPMSTTWN